MSDRAAREPLHQRKGREGADVATRDVDLGRPFQLAQRSDEALRDQAAGTCAFENKVPIAVLGRSTLNNRPDSQPDSIRLLATTSRDANGDALLRFDFRVENLITGEVVVDERLEGIAKEQAFIDHDAFQCGYCTPGQICSAAGLIAEGKAKTPDEIRELMSGNICRCGAYPNILAAIQQAMSVMGGKS